MKLHNNIETTSTADSEQYSMGIDEKSMSHIIKLLTDTYSNPIGSIIREYTANAVDSHKESCCPDPVQITVPTSLRPIFKVQDFGVGLSKDEIVTVYSQYGKSTKRETNDQIGGFGIGAKSAFAKSNQFTVVGVKDGIKTTVVFNRTNEGGSVDVIAEVETDEQNGVIVQIPVSVDEIHEWNQETKDFFRFWSKDEVEVFGIEEDFRCELEHVGGNLYYTEVEKYTTTGEVFISINNIVYKYGLSYGNELENTIDEIHRRMDGKRMFFKVPIGEVDLVPSREELMLSNRTKEYVRNLLSDTMETIAETYKENILKQENYIEALRYVNDNIGIIQYLKIIDDFEYEGKPLKIKKEPYPFIEFSGKNNALHTETGIKTKHGGIVIITKNPPDDFDNDFYSRKAMSIKRLLKDYVRRNPEAADFQYFVDTDVKGYLAFEQYRYETIDINEIAKEALQYRKERKEQLESNKTNLSPQDKTIKYSLKPMYDGFTEQFSLEEIVENLHAGCAERVLYFKEKENAAWMFRFYKMLFDEPTMFVILNPRQREHTFESRLKDNDIDTMHLRDFLKEHCLDRLKSILPDEGKDYIRYINSDVDVIGSAAAKMLIEFGDGELWHETLQWHVDVKTLDNDVMNLIKNAINLLGTGFYEAFEDDNFTVPKLNELQQFIFDQIELTWSHKEVQEKTAELLTLAEYADTV